MRPTARCASALALALALALACGDGSERELSGTSLTGALPTGAGASTSGASEGSGTAGDASGDASGASEPTTAASSEPTTGGEPTTGDDLPPAIACTMRSTTFGGGMVELMVDEGSPATLDFAVPDLPAPELVVGATLRFQGYDIDHPGEEGVVVVNQGAPIDLPADLAWDNQEQSFALDVLGRTVAGTNSVSFGAGTFDGGTFYRIGDVAIDLVAHLESCPEAPAQPPEAIEIRYEDATFSERQNWVHRCDFLGGYAYTAKGAEHIDLDCDGLYAPDGTRQGAATFTFKDLAPATYTITVRSRHTANRNPKGALVVVDGEGKRVKQNDDKDVVDDLWGSKALSGTIDVVVDSTMENESDSVISIRLTPI